MEKQLENTAISGIERRYMKQERNYISADGEKLQIVEVVESKPKKFSYIVFIEK